MKSTAHPPGPSLSLGMTSEPRLSRSHAVALLSVTLLLLVSCATTKPAVLPVWTEVPATVGRSLCVKLHAEGMTGQVHVVTTTAPLITREALIGLAEAAEKQTQDPDKLAASLAAGTSKLPVRIDSVEGCELHPVTSARGVRSDEMLLEFSSPIATPYERPEVGLFARLSLGGAAPGWGLGARES